VPVPRGAGIDWPYSRNPGATESQPGPVAGPRPGYGLADGDGEAEGDGEAAEPPCAAFLALSRAAFIRARSRP
jgi:hypothetical protein